MPHETRCPICKVWVPLVDGRISQHERGTAFARQAPTTAPEYDKHICPGSYREALPQQRQSID